MNIKEQPIVWLDLETGGTESRVHQITQLAACATIGHDFQPCAEDPMFERKVVLSEGHWTQEALDVQNYDADVWAAEAMPMYQVLEQFKAWAYHFTHQATSATKGTKYQVANLGGHNLSFDCDFLGATCKRNGGGERGYWLPIKTWTGGYLDSMHLAKWVSALRGLDFPNLKLETLCKWFDIPLDAHDAMGDVKGTVQLVRRLRAEMAVQF